MHGEAVTAQDIQLNRIYCENCLDTMARMPDGFVDCVITSPPYFGLRDYGVDGQLGLEATPQEYVAKMVDVFEEVRRVLKKDGTLWLNLGDSYAGSWGNYHPNSPPGKHGQRKKDTERFDRPGYASQEFLPPTANTKALGVKPKDLLGMPWRVAFALQEAGWWLRQDIIWSKPNPMPESVIDRCTKAHEYIFLMTKSAKYYFDHEAIKTPLQESSIERLDAGDVLFGGNNRCPDTRLQSGKKWKMPDGWDTGPGGHGSFHRNGREKGAPASWKGSEFHTGKTAIHQLERASKSRDRTVGNRNGEGASTLDRKGYEHRGTGDKKLGSHSGNFDENGNLIGGGYANKRSVWNVATQPFKEAHFATFPEDLIRPCALAGCPDGGIIYDPFMGAGTTALVAHKMGRQFIGSELNPAYVDLANKRLEPYLMQESLFT